MNRGILLATTNPAKREKLAWLLEDLGFRFDGPEAVAPQPQALETASTHRGNAILKAATWSRAYGGLAIASDGGLIIGALGPAWDSLRTARFAGPDADDRQRLEKLLELMAPCAGEERRATWVEAVALARAGEILGTWEAQGGNGLLGSSFPRGHLAPGFWAAALWYFPELGKRYAQLSEDERRQVAEPWSLLKPQLQAFFCAGLTPGEGKP
jgi:XTP/dITP diphosphohydrolase